jgi:hypothetical protein
LNLAEFVTNVAVAPKGGAGGYELLVEEVYSIAIGAQTSTTLAILNHTWGPTLNTSTALFYTTLASVCAVSATPTTVAVTARAAKASGLTTITLITEITYTGTACGSIGLLNCRLSL